MCPLVVDLWNFLTTLFGFPFNTDNTPLNLFYYTLGKHFSKQILALLLFGIIACFSTIWFAKNKLKHDGVRSPL